MALVLYQVVDHYRNTATLWYNEANKDGEYAESVALPAGFGDCLILDVFLEWSAVATVADLDALDIASVVAKVVSPQSVNQAVVGVGRIVKGLATYCVAHIDAPSPVLWRSEDLLRILAPEVDTNASPTTDPQLAVRVQRLRGVSPGKRIVGPRLVQEAPAPEIWPMGGGR